MTGAAGAFLKRCMSHRIEQTFLRAAMGVMTVGARVWTWLDILVGRQEIWPLGFMTLRTKLAGFFAEHAKLVGTVGLMTQETVFHCRVVDHSLAPIFGNFIVATETDDGLSFFEDMVMG
jgi:hypothetical protein